MKSKPVPQLARAVFGGVLACLFLFCSFAAFSPALHEVLHADAKAADHFCQLAIWGKDLFTPASPASAPIVFTEVLLPPSEAQSFLGLPDLRSFPTRGPPVLS